MNNYLLTRAPGHEADYDEHVGFVIAAHTVEEAHTIAAAGSRYVPGGGYYSNTWVAPELVIVEDLGPSTRGVPGIVLSDYLEG